MVLLPNDEFTKKRLGMPKTWTARNATVYKNPDGKLCDACQITHQCRAWYFRIDATTNERLWQCTEYKGGNQRDKSSKAKFDWWWWDPYCMGPWREWLDGLGVSARARGGLGARAANAVLPGTPRLTPLRAAAATAGSKRASTSNSTPLSTGAPVRRRPRRGPFIAGFSDDDDDEEEGEEAGGGPGADGGDG